MPIDADEIFLQLRHFCLVFDWFCAHFSDNESLPPRRGDD